MPSGQRSGPSRRPRVVCLGGGYVALFLARALRSAIRRGDIELTIVSRDNFHTFHGFVAEMLVGRIQPGQIVTPARRIFAPAQFHQAEIEAIDLEARTVTTSRVLDGRQYSLGFDHLVLGMGAQDDLSRYPGLAEHAFRLRRYQDAVDARHHILNVLEMAEIECDADERRRLLTFVVAGANYGGIEVATELIDHLRRLAGREYPRLRAAEVRVVVVHPGSRPLPELASRHERLRLRAEKVLAASGIEFRMGRRLSAATRDEVVLDDGERIASRTLVSCTGSEMPPLLAALDLDKGPGGRVQTDDRGRATGRDNVWAGGDCAAVPHPDGGSCPPVAIYAMTAGYHIGRNIIRSTSGHPLKPYGFRGLGDAVSLGRHRAVGNIRGLSVSGLPAWLLWRSSLLAFLPGWQGRARLVSDWLITPLLGRDIVSVGGDELGGMRPEHYQPGQVIVREGDVGRRFYIIRSGEVDVVLTEPEGEVVVRTLVAGDHFGETAVFGNQRRTATVRARTAVSLLTLGRSETLALADSLRGFDAAVRDVPWLPDPPGTGGA